MSGVNKLKQIAEAFLKLTASGSVDEAYLHYIDEQFIHHNQYYRGDRETLKQAMTEIGAKFTGMKLEVKASMQEDDRVITYSHVRAREIEVAVFHMFKFKNDKIIEMWDVGQKISPNLPNEHGMF